QALLLRPAQGHGNECGAVAGAGAGEGPEAGEGPGRPPPHRASPRQPWPLGAPRRPRAAPPTLRSWPSSLREIVGPRQGCPAPQLGPGTRSPVGPPLRFGPGQGSQGGGWVPEAGARRLPTPPLSPQIMLLETARRYNHETECITFLKDFTYSKDDFHRAGLQVEFINPIFEFPTAGGGSGRAGRAQPSTLPRPPNRAGEALQQPYVEALLSYTRIKMPGSERTGAPPGPGPRPGPNGRLSR
uniref:Uncharacterized protein n=1 Tax=Sarcophilus harrisii TaxID=9305 RepID=A0A7N4UXX7_SARHA